jgi:hypothetical protein
MFLNTYLFLLNIITITFCNIYLKNVYLDINQLKLIKNNTNLYKSKKQEIKVSYKQQLEYMKLKSDCEDIENDKLLYWKVLLGVVAIFMAITIVITEPITIFGVRFRYMTLILMLIVSYIFTKILQKIGVNI